MPPFSRVNLSRIGPFNLRMARTAVQEKRAMSAIFERLKTSLTIFSYLRQLEMTTQY